MEWIGLVALGIILCYSWIPGRVKRLGAAIKRLEKKQRGDTEMSKLITELIDKDCEMILDDDAFDFESGGKLKCHVLDADDEWVKVSYTFRKKDREQQKTKLIRIEAIQEVRLYD